MTLLQASADLRIQTGCMTHMDDQFITTRYKTDCYHCKQIADQIITVVPYTAQVVCEHCGATRVFVPRIEDVVEPGTFVKIDKYPVWQLVKEAKCRNCQVIGPHDLTIGTRHVTARCRNCGFAHFYKFDLEYVEPKLRPDE